MCGLLCCFLQVERVRALICEEAAMSTPTGDDFKLPPELEGERIITLQESEKVNTLSPDSVKRHHADKLVRLSPRRLGIRLRDSLMLRRA
jgi:hypothetical protein